MSSIEAVEAIFFKQTTNRPHVYFLYSPIVELRLSQNKFTGGIESLSTLQNLEILHLEGNNMTGSIPDMFDHIFRLHELLMHDNQFNGSIPKTLTHLQALSKWNSRVRDGLSLICLASFSLSSILFLVQTEICRETRSFVQSTVGVVTRWSWTFI